MHFDVAYNGDKVIEINVSTDPLRTVDITDGDSVRVECGGEFLALDSALGRHFRASGNNYCESELVSETAGYACPRVSAACEGQIVRFRRVGDEWSVDVVDSDDAAQDRVEL